MQLYIFIISGLGVAGVSAYLLKRLRIIKTMHRNMSRQMCERISVDETATVQNEDRESRSAPSPEIVVSDLINDHRLDELKRLQP